MARNQQITTVEINIEIQRSIQRLEQLKVGSAHLPTNFLLSPINSKTQALGAERHQGHFDCSVQQIDYSVVIEGVGEDGSLLRLEKRIE